ncbi:MAG: hypothetical protein QXZ51_03720, partial [Candidatus Bathyarchaeia archaeon]
MSSKHKNVTCTAKILERVINFTLSPATKLTFSSPLRHHNSGFRIHYRLLLRRILNLQIEVYHRR